jgi:ribulose-phosphate 3-epimerase
MSIICPTITATYANQFKEQIELVSQFAQRVHLDLADNIFAPKLLDVSKIWLPDILTDIHVMYEYPGKVIERLINLRPNLVIIHYESDANFNEIAHMLKSNGIKFGIALLQQTDVSVLKQYSNLIDHVLIFSGNLGFFGGQVDMNLFHKTDSIKDINPDIEIGWDGGINPSNAKILADHHVDVLNVGGYIHKSNNPKLAYTSLVRSLETAI